MKLRAVSIITASIFVGAALGLSYATWAGANWLFSPRTPAVVVIEPKVTVTIPTPSPFRAERYESVSAYFKAGNPNATTHRLGEPLIPRQSFSASERRRIHAENGGCCQICGSTNSLEVEHWRGLQNGGSNDRDNLKTLCHDCHLQKTSMDKSLRRQRDKLSKTKR